ncbi:MAG: hypothetical protein FJW34_00165 [Acidobacteria bacterium]|nr:hypothetical protein [Acidobacteriota bacterium]
MSNPVACLTCWTRHAREDGYRAGLRDLHSTRHNYRTSEEWLAWLDGWRAGQVERKRRLAAGPRWYDCGRHRRRRAA